MGELFQGFKIFNDFPGFQTSTGFPWINTSLEFTGFKIPETSQTSQVSQVSQEYSSSKPSQESLILPEGFVRASKIKAISKMKSINDYESNRKKQKIVSSDTKQKSTDDLLNELTNTFKSFDLIEKEDRKKDKAEAKKIQAEAKRKEREATKYIKDLAKKDENDRKKIIRDQIIQIQLIK
jgi:hypothetical protein